MFKSLYLFSRGILKYGWTFFVLVFLDVADVFEKYIKQQLPEEWQGVTVPPEIFWPIVGFGLFWAVFMTYHDLRLKSQNFDIGIDQKLHELHKVGSKLGSNEYTAHQIWFNDVHEYISNNIPELIYIVDTDNALVGLDPSNLRMVRMDSLRKVIDKYQKRKEG